MNAFLKALSTTLLVVVMSCCDFSIDPKTDIYLIKDYTIYSTKGSPTLIHCLTEREGRTQIKIVTNPSFGTVKVANDGSSIYYEPKLQFSKNEDRFVIETVSSQGKRTASILISFVNGNERGPLANYVWL